MLEKRHQIVDELEMDSNGAVEEMHVRLTILGARARAGEILLCLFYCTYYTG